MSSRSFLRNKYGEGYFTVIDDNKVIGWKPLSMEEFFHYDELLKQSLNDPHDLAPCLIQDEIFKKCVTSKEYIKNIDTLPFGIIPTVVQNIMEHSGPISIAHFNNFLESKRDIAQQPLHHLVPLIVRAFPAYQPEDVYKMSFEVFMLRLAQAESLLMMLGVIKDPISLIDPSAEPVEEKKKIRQPPAELRAAWEKQQKMQQQAAQNKKEPPKKPKKKTSEVEKAVFTPPEQSPIFKKDKKHPEYREIGDLNKDRIIQEQAAGSEDESGERARMVKEAQRLYGPVIKNMDFYKKK